MKVLCPVCHKRSAEVPHHIIPKSRGGNITVGVCAICHEEITVKGWRKYLTLFLDYIVDATDRCIQA